ncbi:MAG: flagellar motor switch protein FliG [Armatimonadetes bacterium]|nr:flagellar motor switch protein FliG [Armatimonadota bacterium]
MREQIELSGLQKAAVLLMTLGASTSAEVFKHLDDQQIEMLTSEIVRIRYVDAEIRDMVLAEFAELTANGSLEPGGRGFAAQVLEQALGQEKASKLISKAEKPLRARPFQSLWDASPEQIARLLKEESPQIIALVISNLPPEKAAEILPLMDDMIKKDVAMRICSLGSVDADAIAEIEEAINARLTSSEGEVQSISGPAALAEILNNTERSTEELVLESIKAKDALLCEQIRGMMFLYEDITRLDDRAIQLVLREVDQEDLRLAVKGSSDEIQSLIFRNMSERAAESLKEDLELLERARQSDIDAAQQRIASTMRRMLADGQIALAESQVETEEVQAVG